MRRKNGENRWRIEDEVKMRTGRRGEESIELKRSESEERRSRKGHYERKYEQREEECK